MKRFYILIISVMLFNIVHNANATDTTEFNVHLQQPSCKIDVIDTYDFSTLAKGVDKHTSFDVFILCDANVRTTLVASVVKGNIKPDNQNMEFLIRGTSVPNGSLLRLEDEKGTAIYITGKDKDSFCTGSAVNRKCTIIPVTTTSWGNASAEVEAVIALKVIYV